MTQEQTRTRLGVIGVLIIVGAFTVGSGVFGLLLSATVAVTWYFVPTVYAFTIGQFALITIAPASTIVLGLAEAGLVGILLEPVFRDDRPLRILVLAGGAISLSTSIVWAILELLHPLWKAVGLLTITGIIVSYGLHRYERLALGRIKEVP